MKLINEKGKLFGLINVIDLLVLVALLLAAVGIGWKVMSGTQTAQAPKNAITVTYTARAKNVPDYMRESYQAFDGELPLALVSNTEYLGYATLDKVEVLPSLVAATDSSGTVSRREDPGMIDVVFTCTAEVSSDTAIMTVGTQEIRIGALHTVKTRYFEASTTIESLTIVGDEQ